MKIINVCGARPNFIKIAPIMKAMEASPKIEPLLVHTGQHYDLDMSYRFFVDLDIKEPDRISETGSGTHAEQTAEIMVYFESLLMVEKPDAVLVVGDVNSTLACAIATKKLGIMLFHVEAGLRSHDRKMPEELNRLMTDSVSDHCFVTYNVAMGNLLNEGIMDEKIHLVGNIMADTLHENLARADNTQILSVLNLEKKGYCVLTMHRASNVDDPEVLKELVFAMEEIQYKVKIVFPLHPRTKKKLLEFGLFDRLSSIKNIIMSKPLNYHSMIKLMKDSMFIMTDSGGIQAESTILGVPCLTIRNNTEWGVTISTGTNELVGTSPLKIIKAVTCVLSGKWKKGSTPLFWKGGTAKRIIKVIEEL